MPPCVGLAELVAVVLTVPSCEGDWLGVAVGVRPAVTVCEGELVNVGV